LKNGRYTRRAPTTRRERYHRIVVISGVDSPPRLMTRRSHFAVGTIGRFMHIFRLTMEPGDATRWEYQIVDQLNKQHINGKAHDCDVRMIGKDESGDRRTQTHQCSTTEVKKASFLLSWCCSNKVSNPFVGSGVSGIRVSFRT
jgi:hypothetical protein